MRSGTPAFRKRRRNPHGRSGASRPGGVQGPSRNKGNTNTEEKQPSFRTLRSREAPRPGSPRPAPADRTAVCIFRSFFRNSSFFRIFVGERPVRHGLRIRHAHMRRYLLLLIALLSLTPAARAGNEPDSLLRTLDRAIAERSLRTARKEELLRELKQRRDAQESLRDRYRINDEIIDNYTSFVCDSATSYIHDNLRIAETLGDERLRTESRLRLAFVYSLSGLFVQASDLLRAIDFGALTADQKLSYCWTRIRYYENLTRYTGDEALGADYAAQIRALRDTVMSLLPEDSEMYLKEKAFQLQADGRLEEAEGILTEIYRGQTPDTHSYAMAAMSLAKLYREAGDRERENRFLKLAALTDTRLAVKENEALLTLATNLFEQGDIERSYNYISSALSDANFYNSRVKNSVIARVQPIIESNYLDRIETQRRNLRRSTILLSVFIALLAGALAVIGIQMRMVSRARRNLQEMNGQLSELNRSLNEANVVKEKYIGYFMNRCALYINKLCAYRKDVSHKLRSGQIDRLKIPPKEQDREFDELYAEFDEAFLKLYPSFVEEFNELLRPEARYETTEGRLNTELRIFALMRLGLTNVNQIAEFLRCSLQTVYNYKSKIKSKAQPGIEHFEEEVRKLGQNTFASDSM